MMAEKHCAKWTRLWIFAFLWSLCCCGEQPVKTLSLAQAKRLVYEGLPAKVRQLPGLSLVPGGTKHEGRCVTFDILWSNPGPGSVHVDFYTVDLQTATLWSGPLPAELEAGPAVMKMQRSLRKRLGIPEQLSPRAVEESPCWK